MESTSYVLSFRMVFFYLVTTGWIFDVSLCEDSINQSVNIHIYIFFFLVPASPDQGNDRPCRRDVGRVFMAGVRPNSPSRRRIPSCYRPGPGRGVVELGQRGAH